MPFRSYPETLKTINNMFKNNRLSHAYLIVGENGAPKMGFARYIAQKFYCNEACGICQSCKQILSDNHPNIEIITSSGQNIKKEQITSLIHDFSRSSIVEGPRIYIIDEVEKMNKYSANSLLKFIEEPIGDVHAILTTSNLDAVLPTIKSRCQIISIKSVNSLDIDIDDFNKSILSSITKSKEKAEELLNGDIYENIVELVKKVYYLKKLDRISLARKYYDLLYNKEALELFIEISYLFLLDVGLYNHNIETKIFEIKKNTIDYDNLTKGLNKLQNKIRFNVNAILAFESFMLEGE